MQAIIVGCGRVGAALARTLDGEGAAVTVIDVRADAFERLGPSFGGQKVQGIAFDRETLEAAGVKTADALVAVTSGDNSNVVAARTAREHYGVARVVARIYDPRRAEIFSRLGLEVVAASRMTAERILSVLDVREERVHGQIGPGAGDVLLVTMRVPAIVDRVPVAALSEAGRWVLVALTSAGGTTVPPEGAVLGAGDTVHLAVERDELDALRRVVATLGSEDV